MIELQNITVTPDNTGFQRGVFQLTCVPVLSGVAVFFCSSVVLLTLNDSLWTVPLLHSVSDVMICGR
jgi:hypothetical protein